MRLAEYKKHVLGEATKGLTGAVAGALLLFFGQQWLNSDLEYKIGTRDSYLSAPLGQQGLSMAFDGKPLKNVSVVEFSIVNRTSKQIANAELLFSVDEKAPPVLVAGGVMAPRGMSSAEVVEQLGAKDSTARKFRLKVIPKQRDGEYFHAVFVFEGERAPNMTVSSTSGETSIAPYLQWKDTTVALLYLAGFALLFMAVQLALTSLIEYFWEPRRHKKQVERFKEQSKKLEQDGLLKSKDPASSEDAATIYAEFTRPKPSRFWAKILPEQKYEF